MTSTQLQKLTLTYAALVGACGVMDHAKSNNTNSLVTGAGSALALYYIVHPQLVTNPSYASSVGLGLSAVLLGLKGIRYKVTRRMFPAGVVAVSSLVMAGGYLHNIMKCPS
ncbi:hypothetical protein MPTK1_Vg00060 [Marchantia polymorpha subsp. ruderalis]|nr:hypothetical protein Mp_Vg00060 [Marchantia polymorpha subsp. ruderalis]